MASQWFLIKGQTENGPFGGRELKQMALKGELVPSDRLRNSITGKVVQASALNGLSWADESENKSVENEKINLGRAVRLQKDKVESGSIGVTSINSQPGIFAGGKDFHQKNLNIPSKKDTPYLGPLPPPVLTPIPSQIPQDNWFIHQNGNQFGPITGQNLQKLVSTNQVSGEALIWREGMQGWVPITQIIDSKNNSLGVPKVNPDGVFRNVAKQGEIISNNAQVSLLAFFKSMDLQRSVVIFVCLGGLVGCFLPWFGQPKILIGIFEDNPRASIKGFSTDSGMVALLLFLPGIFLPMAGDRSKTLQGGIFQLAMWPPMAGGAICIYHLIRILVANIMEKPSSGSDFFYFLVSPGVGLYFGAGVCVVLLVWEQAYRYVYSVQKGKM